MASLTTTGIDIDTLDELLSAIEADERANIDAGLNLNPDDVLGQLNGVFVAALAKAHELMEEIYQSAYADTATGQALSYIAALTGAVRRAATKAECIVILEGADGTTVPAGTQFYPAADPASVFEVTANASIGPSLNVTVTSKATVTGPEPSAVVGDSPLTIATPVGGLNAVQVAFDSTPGKAEETDAELRLRREQSLSQAGASTVEAIRADMLTVTGVDACTVFENPTGVTDPDGIPPFAIEVMVYSDAAPSYDSQDVIDQIWLSKPAGTEAHGAISGTATDSLGLTHTIKYSEPANVVTYIDLTLTQTLDGTYVGDAAVQQAIADWALANLQVGQDVFASDIVNVVADLQGVLSVDVGSVRVDKVASPVTINLVTAARELATVSTSNITVTS